MDPSLRGMRVGGLRVRDLFPDPGAVLLAARAEGRLRDVLKPWSDDGSDSSRFFEEDANVNNVLIEVFCGSVDDCVAAEAGGAERIELNSAMFLGGLTPSVGTLVESKKRVDIPIVAMVRPRAGGFCYTESEMKVMEHDAKVMLDNGADGIVFGILHEDGTVDVERCRRIMDVVRDAGGDKEAIFHRAFDVVPDPLKALDDLIELGITRILTKGQHNQVEASVPLLRELIEYAGDRMEFVLGGIRPYNFERVIAETGCDQIHISSFESRYDRSTALRPDVYYGGALYPAEDRYDVVSREGIRLMRNAVDGR